jgi:hypothetical protein
VSARKPTKSDCSGCRDDFYNHGGNGAGGECWSFKDATMEKARFVHINTMPDDKGSFGRVKPQLKPSCYRVEQFVRIEVKP